MKVEVGSVCNKPMVSVDVKQSSTNLDVCEPVWPSSKAFGWYSGKWYTIVVRPWFKSASALLSLQKLWFVDTVL